MTTLQEMYQRTSFIPEYDQMIRSLQPIFNYFGINSFYYSRIISIGNLEYFASVCSLLPWQEFFFENIHEIPVCPSMRQPKQNAEHIIYKDMSDPAFENTLKLTWDKFHTNPVFNTIRKIPCGVEQFGFGLNSTHPQAEYNLLNGLPLVSKFIDFFYQENQKLIRVVGENQVEISTLVGPAFSQSPDSDQITKEKEGLLKQLGLGGACSLTLREREMLKFLAHGYPASYIAKELHLSTKTVEHYIEGIKQKLYCDSKVALIETANVISGILF